MWLLLSVSQAPIIILFSYIYFRDRVEKEPLWLLFVTFIFGALMGIPAALIEYGLDVPTGPRPGVNAVTLFFTTLFGVGLVEEAAKYIVLRWYAATRKAFSEPYDGIMYGAAVALGFAALENLFYCFIFGLEIAVSRMFTAVPLHAAAGVIMGYYVGKAHFETDPVKQKKMYRMGFWTAVMFHGAYDYLLFLGDPSLAYLSLTVLGYQIRLANAAIREYAAVPPLKAVTDVAIPATAAAVAAPLPKKLLQARRSLQVFAFVFGVTALISIAMLAFLNSRLSDLALPMTIGMLVLSLGGLPLIRYTLKGFDRAEKMSWTFALGLFVIMLGTPFFPLSLVGLAGLVDHESRSYFWDHKFPAVAEPAKTVANS